MLALDDWLRPPPTRVQQRNDLALGLLLVASSLLVVELLRATPAGADFTDRTGEAFAWSVACVAPLAVRRRFPITVMIVCSLAFYGVGERATSVSLSLVVQIGLFMSIYTAWAWSRRRGALLLVSAAVVVGMFAWLVELIVTSPLPDVPEAAGVASPPVALALLTFGINVVYFFGAIAWGYAAYRAAHQRELLEQQSEALRAERDLSARRAVVDERLRIARDLHDVVAHHVTGIGVQAAAARHVLDRDPAASRQALSAIEESSRSAVREMHQMVGLLRDAREGDDADARPSLAGLPDLVESVRDERLAVEFREVGRAFPVSAAVGTSAYRIVQEALTNVRRHSTARQAEVVLRYLDSSDAVEVEVLDAGSAAARPERAVSRPGYGLTGVRERVHLHGGECEIGPRPNGGFRVRVRLPAERSTAQPTGATT